MHKSRGPRPGATRSGLDENLIASLAYVLGPVTAVPVYLLEDENEHVRFHAVQSVVVFGGLMLGSVCAVVALVALGLAALAVVLLTPVAILGSLVWLYLVLGTLGHGDPRIPFAASIADRYS